MNTLESLLDEYTSWRDFKVLENANKYPGPSGFFAMVAETSMENNIRDILPKDIYSAHEAGVIYIHKLPFSIYIPYCAGHSISRMLKRGLKTPTIVSRPARHFDTYVDHIANFLTTMQHYFTGAQALSSVEWYAGPFLRRDNPDRRQIKQHLQRLLFNLNYPTRVGMQTCFTNLTLVMDAPRKHLSETSAIYAGAEDGHLSAYENEAKSVVLALSELYSEGDALGQPFTFPIPTLMATAKWLWDDPEVHESVFRTASKKGSFYWLNTNVVDPDATFAMCLHSSELVIFRDGGRVDVAPIKVFLERFARGVEATEPDGAVWYRVKEEVEILAFDEKSSAVTWRRVKRILAKRSKKGISIRLSDGRTVVVTPDHPILVSRRGTSVKKLITASDLLMLKQKIPSALKSYRIPVLLTSLPTTGDYVKLVGDSGREVVIDERMGYLLGLYYGNGTMIFRENGELRVVGLCLFFYRKKNKEKLHKDVARAIMLGSKSGFASFLWKDYKWRSKRCVMLIEPVATKTLLENGLSADPRADAHIPWFIWSSPSNVRMAFIRGFLDARSIARKREGRVLVVGDHILKELLLLMATTSVSAYCHKLTKRGVEKEVIYTSIEPGAGTGFVHHTRREGDVVWVSINDVSEVEYQEPELFVDVELEGDHYFVHSSGVITHNCCRLSINMNELNHSYSAKPLSLRRDLEAVAEDYWKTMERKRFGGLWAMPDITGSVNVVDVNLPRLALEAKGEEHRFWELYDGVLTLVRRACNWFRSRYTYIMRRHPSFYSMIVEYMPEFPAFHFNTIGLIGLPEAAAVLMAEPKLWIDGSRSDWLRATELMRRIVEHATETARRWMREEGVPWNVEEVPGESAAPKLAMLDLKMYPELAEYLPDPENPVYSTSIAPYYSPMDLPDRVEIEQRVQKCFTGGVMMHIFLSEEPNPDALASLTKKLMQTELVYWSYTPAVTYCARCERTYTGLHTSCPRCNSADVEIWSRIVGYYRPLKNWNPPRKREFWLRHHLSALP